MSLSEQLADDDRRATIVTDAIAEVDAEVDDLSGLKGKAIQTGYGALNKIRPDMVSSNLHKLLPRMAPAIDPHYEAGKAAGDVPAHFVANADTIAEDLLSVTDARAAEANNKAAVGVYNKLRKGAKDQVVNAMPRIGAFAAKHGG
jgi:hypothetical protein